MVIRVNYGRRQRGSNFSPATVWIVEFRTIWCHSLAKHMHVSVFLRLHLHVYRSLLKTEHSQFSLSSTWKQYFGSKQSFGKTCACTLWICVCYKCVSHGCWPSCYFVVCIFLFGNVFAILFHFVSFVKPSYGGAGTCCTVPESISLTVQTAVCFDILDQD